MPIIETSDLGYSYDNFQAVQSLNLSVPEGRLFGLIGPNGAGKTTTVKMLCCLLEPTSGWARINDYDTVKEAERVKENIGYLAEGNNLYNDLTIEEYLDFFAELYEIDQETAEKRYRKYLRILDLSDRLKDEITSLSKGMKRKVGVVRSLLNDPPLLIYDEPTAGLDPVTTQFLWGFMRRLVENDKTILMSTHYLHEADKVCDEIAILYRGKLIQQGSPWKLKERYGKEELEDVFMKMLEKQGYKTPELKIR